MAEDRMLSDEILLGLIKANGGGGGTSDYSQLSNKPQINSVELSGNKSLSDLGIASATALGTVSDAVTAIKDGTNIDSFGDVETALTGKQDALTAGRNINLSNNEIKAGVFSQATPDMAIYDDSMVSGTKTYSIEENGLYEIFYCMSLQSTVSMSLPESSNVLFERDMSISNHPVKHMIVELTSGSTVTITQTPDQWQSVLSGILKLDAINVVAITNAVCVADSTANYKLPNDDKYYLVIGACVGKPTGNNATDSTSGGNPIITRTLSSGDGVKFRSVIVTGSDSPNFAFYGYDGGVASIIAFEITFEEGNWDYNLVTRNDLDTALAGKQDTLTFDDTPTENSTNPVKSGGVKSAIDAAVASAYHHAGTKTCAELVAGLLVAANEGNVYNITDSGTTTADFIDGAGQPIKAGDNVGIAKISAGVYKFDLLSGFVDTTNFVQKSQTAGLLKNDGTVDTTIQGDVDSLKSGLINQTARSRSNITSRLTNLATAVAEQNLEKYGYKIGDYFTGASGYIYHLADMDTFYGGYNNNAIVNTHHISLVVKTGANSKWAETNDTSGGYKTSTLHSFLSSTVLDNIKSDMIALFGGSTGLEHLVSHKLLWTTATSGAWAWSDNAEYISALSEPQVYGTNVWAIDGYQTGEAWKWLEIFHKFNFCEILGNIWWRLRSISSASLACAANNRGYAIADSASNSGGAVGLIIFH